MNFSLLRLLITPRLLALMVGTEVRAVEFAPVFHDGAVLRAGLRVNVWGLAEAGKPAPAVDG